MGIVKSFVQQLILSLLLVSACSAQQNICIDSTNQPEELSLALCPSAINKIAAGANIINFYNSQDTGRTWHHGTMSSSYGVWGDPCLLCDTAGNFYFIHLAISAGSWLDRMVCQKSTDGGKTWSDGSFAGLNPPKNQDKPGAAVDFSHSPYRNRIYLSWTQFDKYHSDKVTDSSHILFAYSADAGISWSKPVRLDNNGGDCHDSDNTVEGAVPCVGPSGEVYDSWGGPQGVVFKRSFDGGATWSAKEIKVADAIGGWDYEIGGIDRCDGMPVTACDISNGPHRGTVYVCWSDQRNGTDNTDVWLAKSFDKGQTWSKPQRINTDESGHEQFMHWFTVDPVTGYLYSLFYDRREHEGDTTDVYLAVSSDGGNSFRDFRINDKSFVPTSVDFFGDYIDVAAYNNLVRPMWMQLNNHQLKMFTAIINPGDLDWVLYQPAGPRTGNYSAEEVANNSSIWFRFNVVKKQKVNLSVIDMWGKTVYSIYSNREWDESSDKYSDDISCEYLLDVKKSGLKPGVYAYKLEKKAGNFYKWFLVY